MRKPAYLALAVALVIAAAGTAAPDKSTTTGPKTLLPLESKISTPAAV